MNTRAILPLLALGLGLGALAATPAPGADPAAKPDSDKIAKLIKQLGSDDFDDREKATRELDAVGVPALDALREALKNPDEEVHKRAETLIAGIEKRIESANALAPKRVHLVYKDTPLTQAVDDFQKKSGYTIKLDDPDNKLKDRTITLDTGDVTFWQAFDQFCAKAGLKEAEEQNAAGPGGLPPPVAIPLAPPARGNAVPPPPPPPPPAKPGGATPAAGQAQAAAQPAAPPATPAQPAAPGQAAAPPVPPPPPGAVIRGGLAAPVPGFGGPAASDHITLTDGKPDALPTDASSAVRIRALPKADHFGPAQDGEIQLALQLSLEPRLKWQNVEKVKITKAIDDQKQELSQVAGDANPIGVGAPGAVPALPGAGLGGFPGRAVIMPFPGPGFGLNFGGMNQDAAVRLKKGDKPSKSLTELSGTVSAQILGEVKPVITVKDILKKDAEKTAKGGENGQIKVLEASKNDDGQVTIRLELQAPNDVVAPDNGLNPIMRPRPGRRGGAAAPAPPAGGAAIGIAVNPGGAVAIGPGGWMQAGGTGALSLIDDKDNVVKQTSIQTQQQVVVNNNVAAVTMIYTLTFQADKGQEPAKLVYSGRKVLSVEIPFTLKDVPLP